MKLKYEMNIVKIDDETVAIPLSEEIDNNFKGILRMNESTESILSLLKEDTTIDEIVLRLKQEYNADDEFLRKNVVKIIKILKKNNLLID